ncbi:ribosome hibernation promotion factor [Agaricicola taiwanensis]|uniref:Ribosome hibernation promoting factor n=1 Tax=Agaricicola taiwanensis TaxID=591372 RepID=A0A8J2VJC4_9RHOB|nr:ribosome-associated translation inhibitor RaiA [Agaricicola taiwanensis]GGE32550.1 ribosome hibernation promotion factor [Agaricicola taiwanensis]
MSLRISGKNIDIGDALRSQVEGRIADALSKYFSGGYSGHVTVEREGAGFRTECALHLDSGIDLQSTATAMDAYASFDQAAERIEKRLRRYKRRLKDRHAAAIEGNGFSSNYTVFEAPTSDEEIDVDGFSAIVIAEKAIKLKQLPVSSAVVDLDLTGAPCVIFRNAANGRINVVYRRSDGNIGWVDPAPDGGN